MSQFEKLLAELQAEEATLVKSIPADGGEGDDKAIQAAADEGGEKNPEDNDDEKNAGDGKSGEPMAKSIKVGDEDVQLVDADALIKSIQEQDGRLTAVEDVLAKALASTTNAVKAQGALIKSMQGEIAQLRSTGTGRKTVLTVHEKPASGEEALAKSQGDGGQITAEQFMAKSQAAYKDGKITGRDLTTIDVAVRTGQVGVLDKGLITKVIGS